MTAPRAIPSPNIWNWPRVYEIENRAQDVDGRIFSALDRIVALDGATVVDVGCGTGFHLPLFASRAAHVIGVEPHDGLRAGARRRTDESARVEVVAGHAEALPLADASVDVVHARTAYFFGSGCGAGISEAMRVLRPGGTLAVVDLDASASPYGDWMRADLPHYDYRAVEAFFDAQGFSLERVDTRWQFERRADLIAVLGIEFGARVAKAAARSIDGLGFDVRYRLHWRRRPVGIELY